MLKPLSVEFYPKDCASVETIAQSTDFFKLLESILNSYARCFAK